MNNQLERAQQLLATITEWLGTMNQQQLTQPCLLLQQQLHPAGVIRPQTAYPPPWFGAVLSQEHMILQQQAWLAQTENGGTLEENRAHNSQQSQQPPQKQTSIQHQPNIDQSAIQSQEDIPTQNTQPDVHQILLHGPATDKNQPDRKRHLPFTIEAILRKKRQTPDASMSETRPPTASNMAVVRNEMTPSVAHSSTRSSTAVMCSPLERLFASQTVSSSAIQEVRESFNPGRASIPMSQEHLRLPILREMVPYPFINNQMFRLDNKTDQEIFELVCQNSLLNIYFPNGTQEQHLTKLKKRSEEFMKLRCMPFGPRFLIADPPFEDKLRTTLVATTLRDERIELAYKLFDRIYVTRDIESVDAQQDMANPFLWKTGDLCWAPWRLTESSVPIYWPCIFEQFCPERRISNIIIPAKAFVLDTLGKTRWQVHYNELEPFTTSFFKRVPSNSFDFNLLLAVAWGITLHGEFGYFEIFLPAQLFVVMLHDPIFHHYLGYFPTQLLKNLIKYRNTKYENIPINSNPYYYPEPNNEKFAWSKVSQLTLLYLTLHRSEIGVWPKLPIEENRELEHIREAILCTHWAKHREVLIMKESLGFPPIKYTPHDNQIVLSAVMKKVNKARQCQDYKKFTPKINNNNEIKNWL